MRELNFLGAGKLAWNERPEPELLAATDAIVRPFVCGRCDGDTLPLHQPVSRGMQAGLRTGLLDPAIRRVCGPIPFQGPFAIGHETIAEITALGPQAEGLAVGDKVVVPWSISCGECANCRRGLTSKCTTTRRQARADTGPNRDELIGPGGAEALLAYESASLPRTRLLPRRPREGGIGADRPKVPAAT